MILSDSIRIAIICGPTGAGKTKFAIDLASDINGEIVGADSMQIYRHMDIGTAKPTPCERAAAKHHLIDNVDPNTPFDAACYVRKADDAIKNIVGKGKRPIVVGGTGLYIKALTLGLFEAPFVAPEIRRRLKETAAMHGNRYLHDYLKEVDPLSAVRINVNDTQRLLRALEVYETSGKPISFAQKEHGFNNPRYETLKIGLLIEREQLYERINQRVDLMINEGLLSEVRALLKMGYEPTIKPMQALGYRHMIEFIQHKKSWEDAVSTLKRDHRRYAKRQMTWFRADPEVNWLTPPEIKLAKQMASEFFNPVQA